MKVQLENSTVESPMPEAREALSENRDTTARNLEEYADHFTAESKVENVQRSRYNQLDPTSIGHFREAIEELTSISPDDPNYTEAQYTLQEIHLLLIAHLHTPSPNTLGASIERTLDIKEAVQEVQEERKERAEELFSALELHSLVQLRNVSVKGVGLQECEFDGVWRFDEIASQDLEQGAISGHAHFTGKIRYADGGTPTNCVNFGLDIAHAELVLGSLSKPASA